MSPDERFVDLEAEAGLQGKGEVAVLDRFDGGAREFVAELACGVVQNRGDLLNEQVRQTGGQM